MKILLSLLAWAALAHGLQKTGLARQKRQSGRASVQGCTVSPNGVDDPLTPAKENAIVSITCTTDSALDNCVFQHVAPMDVGLVSSSGGSSSSNSEYNTKCNANIQNNGQTCIDDSRITYVMSSNQCGMRISKSEPDDTGRWIISVAEALPSGQMVDSLKTVTIYTFNRTLIEITDDRDELITRSVEAWFNYDDNEEEWRINTGGWDELELNCNARGGRPEPEIKWFINNDDRNSFGGDTGNSDATNVFSVRESYGRTYDDEGYIRDKVSQLIFDVDRDLLTYLSEKNQININPTTGTFSFDLVCEVDQGDYGTDRTTTTVTVRRVYFEDKLSTSTIGWIVGGVLIGVLLILIVLIALWAKASGRWCFEDEEYKYGNPSDPKRRPRTQAQR